MKKTCPRYVLGAMTVDLYQRVALGLTALQLVLHACCVLRVLALLAQAVRRARRTRRALLALVSELLLVGAGFLLFRAMGSITVFASAVFAPPVIVAFVVWYNAWVAADFHFFLPPAWRPVRPLVVAPPHKKDQDQHQHQHQDQHQDQELRVQVQEQEQGKEPQVQVQVPAQRQRVNPGGQGPIGASVVDREGRQGGSDGVSGVSSERAPVPVGVGAGAGAGGGGGGPPSPRPMHETPGGACVDTPSPIRCVAVCSVDLSLAPFFSVSSLSCVPGACLIADARV